MPQPLAPSAPVPGATLDSRNRALRDLRISVTDRCNFRCSYCMPAEIFGERYAFLPKPEILSFEEIERLARIFVGLGVEKLRITGGEPLLRQDLPRLIEKLARIDGVQDLALTTNAVLLPKLAPALRDAGLQRVTISLDSLDEDVFAQMSGERGLVSRVLDGIAAAEAAGLTPIKINAVVQKGVNDHTAVELARHFKGSGHIVRFIEYMDVGTRNAWKLDEVLPARELVARISAELPLEPADPNYLGEVAKRWRYVDGEGEIGVISSVTQAFCGSCTRARVSTDGQLFTCLFGSAGTSLRDPLRARASDEEVRALIARIWLRRDDRYSELRSSAMAGDADATGRRDKERVEMYQIGG